MERKIKSLRATLGLSLDLKVVDIGARQTDDPPCYAPLVEGGKTTVIGFEPDLDAYAELQKNRAPHETHLPHAVGDGQLRKLWLCENRAMTSLLEPNPEVTKLFHGFPEWCKIEKVIDIKTERLDDLAETADLDFMKIDIQGPELMAFENAVNRLETALVLHTEVEFLQLYVDQPLFSDVDQFLRKQGFILHRFDNLVSRVMYPMLVNGHPYAPMSQVFFGDAIFVKDFTRLEKLSSAQILKMAVILCDCYLSYDLVLHLLTEHDRRFGSTYTTPYMAALAAPS